MGFNGTFDVDYRGKRGQALILETYLSAVKSIMNFTKKIPSLKRLITSIVCNDSFGVRKLPFIDWLKKSDEWGVY